MAKFTVVLIILAILSSQFYLVVNTTSADEKMLTNETIITLAKSGLSDETIIALIKKSQTEFDLSPESLIKLRQAGVSNNIIEAMLGIASSEHVKSNDDKTSQILPTAYGIYAVDGHRIYELRSTRVESKMGLVVGGRSNRGMAVDGVSGEPTIMLKSQMPSFIVYRRNVNVDYIYISKLTYIDSMRAYEFNILNTNPQFFRNVYGRDYNDRISIRLWRPEGNIQYRVEPISDRPEMYRLIPESALLPGKYVLYFDKTLHQSDIIFTTSPNRRAEAYYFGKQ